MKATTEETRALSARIDNLREALRIIRHCVDLGTGSAVDDQIDDQSEIAIGHRLRAHVNLTWAETELDMIAAGATS